MTKPISPKDITSHKQENFPPEVFEAWNKLIAYNFDGTSAIIKVSEAKEYLQSYLSIRAIEYYSKYLNIEDVYRKAGWKVTFYKPGYDESYEAYYEFEEE